jgi:hypothetical protein
MIFNTKPPKGNISGYVMESVSGKPIESARIRLKGTKARKKAFKILFSDADGLFEFNELDADTYDIFAIKTDFKSTRQVVKTPEGEENIIEIKLVSIQKEEQKRDLVEEKRGTDTPHPAPNKLEEAKPEKK